MPGNPRDIITAAERRFLVRIRIGVRQAVSADDTFKLPLGLTKTAVADVGANESPSSRHP